MKLFAFRPNGHGEDSFFTIAESEEQARENIEKIILSGNSIYGKSKEGYPINCSGWNTDYYTLTVYEIGEVAINSN